MKKIADECKHIPFAKKQKEWALLDASFISNKKIATLL